MASNVSSPNTKGLRDLQSETALGALLGRIAAERDRIVQGLGRALPLAVKIAPDLDADAMDLVFQTLAFGEIVYG